MKHFFSLSILVFFAISCFAQQVIDVVHLKNGSMIRGSIVEQDLSENLKIQTADGSIFVYTYNEILKITKDTLAPPAKKKEEAPKLDEYGGIASLGIAMGGGGLVGMQVRVYLSHKIALEGGAFLRPSTYSYGVYDPNGNPLGDENHFFLPVHITGGIDFLFSEKYVDWKRRIYRDGIVFNAGHTLTSHYDESFLALGWAHERFNKASKKYCYFFQLGAGILIVSDNYPTLTNLDWDTPVLPMLYWKFNWNWFLK